jgi:hypothetical protein
MEISSLLKNLIKMTFSADKTSTEQLVEDHMNKKHLIIAASFFAGVLTTGTMWQMTKTTSPSNVRNGQDDAFLALIKNDQSGFEAWVKNGGDLFAYLPEIDGKKLTVAEGLSYFERTNFIAYLQANKVKFIKQSKDGKDDVLSLAVAKNNPELFKLLLKENPDLTATYGDKKMTLMHLVSAHCASKLTDILHTEKKMEWDLKAKDGSTPLTVAAAHECLSVLGYWKDQKADFNRKDGRGTSAMSVMRQKKDAATIAFLQSFETRRAPASAFVEPEMPNFYKKRIVPKDQKVDYSALIEPEDRPLDATESAEASEFAD